MASKYAPVITAAGITAPDFATNLANLKADYQSIFGADVYLGNDSQDGQFLAIIAQGFADCGAACVAVYNAFSPATAQGNGLSSVVKINGLTRALPSSSTCDVTIVGAGGTIITNGQITDTNGRTWSLPGSVTIPTGGEIIATATCQTPGAIAAGAATLTKIKTPIFGWQTVTNAAPAIAGNPVETDAGLRRRQSISVALPSQSIFEGIVAEILKTPAVTRARGYENNTGATDGNGIAANSLAFIVEGGINADIFAAIAAKIPPGIPTVGAQTTTVTDSFGSTRTLRFARPTNANVFVAYTLKALGGWSVATEDLIEQAVAAYINTLRIGDSVSYFDLAVPAKLLGLPQSATFSLSAMTIKKNVGGTPGTIDLALAYNEVPFGDVANITFTIV